MAKYKLIVELPEDRYRELCRLAELCDWLPAEAAEAILCNCLVSIMGKKE